MHKRFVGIVLILLMGFGRGMSQSVRPHLTSYHIDTTVSKADHAIKHSKHISGSKLGEHLFYNSRFENNVEFIFSGDSVTALKAIFSDQVTEYKKIQKWNPMLEELKQFEGSYINPETNTVYTIEMDEERLVAKHQWNEDRVLTPFKENTFFGFYTILQIEFTFDDQGEPEGFHMHDPDLSPIWFQRINFKD